MANKRFMEKPTVSLFFKADYRVQILIFKKSKRRTVIGICAIEGHGGKNDLNFEKLVRTHCDIGTGFKMKRTG